MPLSPCTVICDEMKMDALAKTLSNTLKKGAVVTLSGELGGGKTTFAIMLCNHLGIQDQVTSPTYTYLNLYDEKIAHFDLYRLKHQTEFFHGI